MAFTPWGFIPPPTACPGPHGGGGPGAGPIGVKDHLSDYLPAPLVVADEDELVGDEILGKTLGCTCIHRIIALDDNISSHTLKVLEGNKGVHERNRGFFHLEILANRGQGREAFKGI